MLTCMQEVYSPTSFAVCSKDFVDGSGIEWYVTIRYSR